MSNDVGNKMRKNVCLYGGLLFLVACALVVWTFRSGKFTKTDGNAYVFGGWIYGTEDRKEACSALALAGLNDYSWDDGKLSAPCAKIDEYQSVLASAGAYPKAPSEVRDDALMGMNVFESETKTRMRELNACASQLERMIGRMRGIEYVTVGVRSRREQVGLVARNVVTASVGIACKDGFELDSQTVSSITLATKHQMGIEDDSNISILDLREGRSYLGTHDDSSEFLAKNLNSEKERIENYWRNKYYKVFEDIEKIRISVTADVGVRTKQDDVERHKTTDVEQILDPNQEEPTFSCEDEDEDELNNVGNSRRSSSSGKVSLANYQTRSEQTVVRIGNAQLGNPKRKLLATSTEQNLETAEQNVDILSVNLSDGLRQDKEMLGASKGKNFLQADVDSELSILDPNSSGDLGKVFWVDAALKKHGKEHKDVDRSEIDHGRSRSPILQTNFEESSKLSGNKRSVCQNMDYELRSIMIQIAVPRSYVLRATQKAVSQRSSTGTFADDKTDADKEAEADETYHATEEQIISETKDFAISLFRPVSEQLGWSETELVQSFFVDVFSDVDSFGKFSDDRQEEDVKFVANFGSSEYSDVPLDNSFTSNWEENYFSHDQEYIDIGGGTIDCPVKSGAVANTSGKIADISTTDFGDEEPDEKEIGAWSRLLVFLRNWHKSKNVAFLKEPLFYYLSSGILIVVLILFVRVEKSRKVEKCSGTKKELANNVQDSKINNRKLVDEEEPQDSLSIGSSLMDAVTRSSSSRYSKGEVSKQTHSGLDAFEDYSDDIDDELERELTKISAFREREATYSDDVDLENDMVSRSADVLSRGEDNDILDEYWNKRREVLNMISKYPEQAAASLQGWVRKSNV